MYEGMQRIVHSMEELSVISVQSSGTIENENIAAATEEQSAIIGEIATSKLIEAGRNPGTNSSEI